MLLDELIRHGARQAEPGEFTARAYFNGRIDLTEAEGVAATIAAQGERELAAARQLMAGELARRLKPVLIDLADTLALIEVGIDFSEEDVTFISPEELNARIEQMDGSLEALLRESARFERLSHEPRIVLVGRPNAGKSTLLNALAGHARAVVSPQQGTTRDAIWAQVRLRRGMVRVIDIAGLDALAEDSISRQMQDRARQAIEQADLLVLVRDCTDDRPSPLLGRPPDLHVASKSDLAGSVQPDELPISVVTSTNINELRDQLDLFAFGETTSGAALAVNARHVQAIQEAREALCRAIERTNTSQAELLALELREALDVLGSVLGSVTPDDVLGRIFSGFCIGK
jgi:tRNA modification GTPase